MAENDTSLLKVEDLVIHYDTEDGLVEALNGVSIEIKEGETFGLVGETGAGKTTLARGIMRLVPDPPGKIIGGKVFYEGKDLLSISEAEMRAVRGQNISMIFQDPMTSLNPVMPVGEQIMEVLMAHNDKLDKKTAFQKACEILELVGIVGERANDYPHQFSGGMKQRVIIAIALACNPRLLIADEPTTALDVTIQAQILETIRSLKNKTNAAMLLITHDLGVVAQNCDHVGIIYAGEIVEIGTLREIFKNPKHPYTLGLFGSIPSLTQTVKRLQPVEGLMPDPTKLPKGCKFNPRCKHATDKCREQLPHLEQLEGTHQVRCWMFAEENK